MEPAEKKTRNLFFKEKNILAGPMEYFLLFIEINLINLTSFIISNDVILLTFYLLIIIIKQWISKLYFVGLCANISDTMFN